MRPFKFIRDLIVDYDYFNTTQLLRYSGDPEFKTFTGGFCSISVVVCVLILLINMSMQTFKKEYIEWKQEMVKEAVPSKLNIKTGDSSQEFMFGVQISGLNLSAADRYFNVQASSSLGNIQMESCKSENWNVNEQIKNSFEMLSGTNWLCPVPGQNFDIQGKFSSATFSTLDIMITSCTAGFISGTTCKTQAEIDALITSNEKMYLSIFFINSIVNPNEVEPISYYLDDSNYIIFTDKLGVFGEIQISDYEVTTDQSFIPITSQKIEKGFLVKNRMVPFVEELTSGSGYYSSFQILKSSDVIKYTRSFRKVDFLISYAGGLIGAVIGLMFFMNIYTKICYEITMGSRLFRNDENQPIQAKSFNVFRFLGYGFFHFWHNFLGCNMKWKAMQVYDDCKAEAEKQLDIKFILEKLIFFEQSIQILFGDVRFKGLHLMKKNTLSDAKKYREMYYLKHSINSKNQEKEENQQEKKEKEDQNQSQMIGTFKSPNRLLSNNKVHNIQIYSQSEDIENSFKEGQNRHSKKMISVKFNKKKALDQQIPDINENISQAYSKESVSAPSDFELVIEDETFRSLAQIKMEAQSGNLISKSIWERVEDDLKQVLGLIAPAYFEQIQNLNFQLNHQEKFKKEVECTKF